MFRGGPNGLGQKMQLLYQNNDKNVRHRLRDHSGSGDTSSRNPVLTFLVISVKFLTDEAWKENPTQLQTRP